VRKSVTANAAGKEEPFELPDDLEWTAARAFFVRGRRDGAVQVGGTNVFPDRVAAKIARHPGVRECAVRLMRVDEGDRLKAFIVGRETVEEGKAADALREWMRSELTASERPAALKFGAALPRNALGKLTDWDA
jgi:4-coumarate--CoA ligase